MMDMKENPKLDLASSYEDRVSEEKKSTQKISILDHTNGFQYTTTDKSDCFAIDMESFSNGVFNKEMNPNPRITVKIFCREAFHEKGRHQILLFPLHPEGLVCLKSPMWWFPGLPVRHQPTSSSSDNHHNRQYHCSNRKQI
ncbi:uncharacterized protein LOC120147014 isoform X1 [Hibiscus syriacus]|uniref:uncharacterized protein LOC120147014 isoform X1 n=1 Tax=Hibiscus syriacus TaxID=106335 RepID=UPI001924147B|nr:uncharacterized protein LOC120147014 isoform X1 [Hibiscus syriacus]XP_039016422.1 uncharacterized protein LOC120147014 isoform X1 [Hibiscus syriacus]